MSDTPVAPEEAEPRQPSRAEAMMHTLTLRDLIAMPREQQDEILAELRALRDAPHEPSPVPRYPAGRPAEHQVPPRPAEAPAAPAAPEHQQEAAHTAHPSQLQHQKQARRNPQQGDGNPGVLRMAPPAPGAMIAGEQPTPAGSEGDEHTGRGQRPD